MNKTENEGRLAYISVVIPMRNEESFVAQYLLSAAFVLWLLLTLVLLLFGVRIWWIPAESYLFPPSLAPLAVSLRRGIEYVPLALPIFPTLHLLWNTWFYFGTLIFGITKIRAPNNPARYHW